MKDSIYKETFLVLLGLLILLAATISLSFTGNFPFKPLVTYILVTGKAALVLAFYMHVRGSRGIVRFFMSCGLIWLTFLLILGAADYLSR